VKKAQLTWFRYR